MKARREKAVCALVSGGLDSAVLIHALAHRFERVFPLYVRAGLRWEPVEEYWLKRFLRATASRNGCGAIHPLTVARLPVSDVYGAHWSLTGRGVPGGRSADSAVYLPGRNLLLLSKAAVFCALRQIPVVALGPLKGNPFPDATADFFRGFARLASRALERPLRVLTPFAHLSKPQVVRAGRGLPLELTLSCMRPAGRRHCGVCNKCAERRQAFRAAGLPDRTAYATRPRAHRRGRPRGLAG
jgi:7-cyano-7-deazaguanine synthase